MMTRNQSSHGSKYFARNYTVIPLGKVNQMPEAEKKRNTNLVGILVVSYRQDTCGWPTGLVLFQYYSNPSGIGVLLSYGKKDVFRTMKFWFARKKLELRIQNA